MIITKKSRFDMSTILTVDCLRSKMIFGLNYRWLDVCSNDTDAHRW